MLKYRFCAVNTENDDTFCKMANADSITQLIELWHFFKNMVPYDDWFSDNECIDGDPSWLDHLT